MTCTHAATEIAAACIDTCPICQAAVIDRLTERCAMYKGQVEAGSHEIERLRVQRC